MFAKLAMRPDHKEKHKEEAKEWLIVLRADGVVDSVEGGAPTSWVGKTLAEAKGTPGALRRAGAQLLHARPHEDGRPVSSVRRHKVQCEDEGHDVEIELLLIEALPLRRAPTRVNQLVMRTLDLFASQAQSSKIDLTVHQATDVPPNVILDAEKIAWALSTLVVNALRYTETHVGVDVSWDDSAYALLIEVSDNGPGIPKERLPWLFERRDPSSGQYAGLALPMVREVLAAHRGSVTVKTHAGRPGTTFTLKIPQFR
jgi:nitrogen-specific signal transduction histidine kinase